MGVLFDYFAAPDDDAAGTVLDLVGGPGESSFPTAAFKVAGDRSGEAVAVAGDGERMVVTVTDELLGALSTAAEPRLRAVAGPWSRTEEFGGGADPAGLVTALADLAGLARAATERGDRLYCWVCV